MSTPTTSDVTVADSGKYYINVDGVTVTAANVTTGAEVYIANGISVTFKGAASADTITVYSASSDNKWKGSGDTKVALTLGSADDSVVVKSQYNSSTANSQLYVSGTLTNTTNNAIAGTAGTGSSVDAYPDGGKILVESGKTLKVGVASTAITNISYGVLVNDDSNTNLKLEYHAVGADVKTITLDNNDTITIVNGSASVSKGNNIVKVVDVVAPVTAVTVSANGSGAIPTITGASTAGTITRTSGWFS